ncbi:hypothetical protein BH18ACT9_BH18ACT9_12900 [soil metagenome]
MLAEVSVVSPTVVVMMNRATIDSLDRDSVLDAAVASRLGADRHEADLLLVAAHFADLHPVPAGGVRAGFGDHDIRVSNGVVGGDLGRERYAPLAGPGTPEVAEFAPIELGTALGVTSDAAKALIGDALELRHRLPKLWQLVIDGRLQAWKARAVASETAGLSSAAVAFVDQHVSVIARRNRVPGLGQLRALVHEALLRCDPDVAAGREQAALDKRGVWSSHRDSTATTTITIVADTPDAVAFDHTIGDVAMQLGNLGDRDPLDIRRARAVGILADPQRCLDLVTGTNVPGPTAAGVPVGKLGAMLYLHLDVTTTLEPGTLSTGNCDSVGREERYGALTRDLMRTWLDRADQVTVRPVLRGLDSGPAAVIPSAAGYVPPPVMAEQVRLRDQSCVFPDCAPPAPATSTTSSATAHTPMIRRVTPTRTTSRPCAGGTIGSRPTAAGPTGATRTAPTPGPAPPAASSPSTPDSSAAPDISRRPAEHRTSPPPEHHRLTGTTPLLDSPAGHHALSGYRHAHPTPVRRSPSSVRTRTGWLASGPTQRAGGRPARPGRPPNSALPLC